METLKIICGSDTINFDGTAGYHVLWGKMDLGTARQATSRLGNQPVHTDVEVRMDIWIEDQGGVTAQVKLQTLTDVLEECVRWARRETGTAAGYIEYESTTSTIDDPLQAEIVELPDDWLQLPSSYDAVSRVAHIGDMSDPIRLKFIRRGLWLDVDNLVVTSATAAANNPSKMTATFATSIRQSSPVNINISGINTTAGIYAAYLPISRAAADMVLLEAESASGTGASTADAAGLASGGSVWRVTAAGTTYVSFTRAVGTITAARKYTVLTTLRKNTSTRTWKTYVELLDADGLVLAQSRVQVIEGTDTNPRLHSFGLFVVPITAVVTTIKTYVACDSASGSPTLDFDVLVILALDHPENRVLLLNPGGTQLDGYAQLNIAHNSFYLPDPSFTLTTPGARHANWRGDAWITNSTTTLTAIWLGPTTDKWVTVDTTPANKQLQMTVTRTDGYLTPQ